MQEEDIRTIARTLAAQIRRDRRKDTREHRNLARIATEGEGHVVTTLLVHGHYRGTRYVSLIPLGEVSNVHPCRKVQQRRSITLSALSA